MSWSGRIEAAYAAARELAGEEPRAWSRLAHEQIVARVLGDDPAGFLAWAREDPWWSLVVADCAQRVCAKPREASAFVLVEGLRQRLVDDGLIEDEE